MFGVFEADIAIIFKILLFVSLDVNGVDFSKLGEHFFKLVIVSSLRQILDKKVIKLGLSLNLSLILLFMFKHFNLLFLHFFFVHILQSEVSFFFRFKLDIGVASTLSIWIGFQFAR